MGRTNSRHQPTLGKLDKASTAAFPLHKVSPSIWTSTFQSLLLGLKCVYLIMKMMYHGMPRLFAQKQTGCTNFASLQMDSPPAGTICETCSSSQMLLLLKIISNRETLCSCVCRLLPRGSPGSSRR